MVKLEQQFPEEANRNKFISYCKSENCHSVFDLSSIYVCVCMFTNWCILGIRLQCRITS